MFCETRLQIGPGRFYCEAAHIKPLGKPHDGPDKTGNMIVLCPNHHLQFDRGVLRLRTVGAEYMIVSKVKNDNLHGRKLVLRHELDPSCVHWHFQWFGQPRS
jgi:predicted restriction endonuclease